MKTGTVFFDEGRRAGCGLEVEIRGGRIHFSGAKAEAKEGYRGF